MKLQFGNTNHIEMLRLMGKLAKEKKKKSSKATAETIKRLEQRIDSLSKIVS